LTFYSVQGFTGIYCIEQTAGFYKPGGFADNILIAGFRYRIFLRRGVDVRYWPVFLIYLATAVTLGVIGIFCSSFFKRTQISMVVSYLAVFFLIVGTLIIAVFMRSLGENQGINPDSIPFITYFNPLMALYSIFPSQGPGMDIIYSIIGRGQSSNMMVASNGMALWKYNFIADGVLIVMLLVITIISLDPVGRFQWLRRLRQKKEIGDMTHDLPAAQ
jgi:hypothetical protein